MKLSIIIPYDRYEQYLYDCLESISEQNLDDFETLLIASKSAKIDQQIQEYPVNLKIITVEDGLNVAKKRNIGLENACGEYIYFIDWDDYLMPGSLNALLTRASQDNLDLVTGIRKVTWFKKKVFETMGDEKNNELNLKDKDHDLDNKFLEKEYNPKAN